MFIYVHIYIHMYTHIPTYIHIDMYIKPAAHRSYHRTEPSLSVYMYETCSPRKQAACRAIALSIHIHRRLHL